MINTDKDGKDVKKLTDPTREHNDNHFQVNKIDLFENLFSNLTDKVVSMVSSSITGLNSFSNNVTAAGLMLGVPMSAFVPEAGVTVIGISDGISTTADVTATGLAGIAAMGTGKKEDVTEFKSQLINLGQGFIIGGVIKGTGKVASKAKDVVKELERVIMIPIFEF